MKKESPSNLAGIAGVRASIGGWPISTAGMSSTSRGLYFDVREASHGVELLVPACNHHAVMVALASSRQFRCETHRVSREVSCRAGDLIVVRAARSARLSGEIPAVLPIGIETEQLRNNSRLDKSLRGEDDQTGSILYLNDLFALYIGGKILEEM